MMISVISLSSAASLPEPVEEEDAVPSVSAVAVSAVRALPRKPVPQRANTDPAPRTVSRDKPEPPERGTDGSRLERLQTLDSGMAPHELRIDGLGRLNWHEQRTGRAAPREAPIPRIPEPADVGRGGANCRRWWLDG